MSMSDKTVGIIGQKYEDRKTGKCGILESRDDKYKTLLFRADDGSTFNISNSSFRSNWRKAKEEGDESGVEQNNSVAEDVTEEVNNEEVTESEDEPAPAPKAKSKKKSKAEKKEPAPTKSYDGITKEDAINKFTEAVGAVRKVEVINESDAVSILVDENVKVAVIRDNGNETFNIAMLPDLFTLTDWRSKLHTASIEYKIGADSYLGVVADTKVSCIPEILDIIEETVKDINVYGYILDESEDTVDEAN